MKYALILCSGGLDSVTLAHYIKNKKKHKKITVLFFNYDQRNVSKERKCAKLCSKDVGAEFKEIKLDYLSYLSQSLINSNKKHTKISRKDLKDSLEESKKWYVPCRNTIFLINALALAESIYVKNKEISDIFVGFKCEGKESYPDTTKKFVKKINELSKVSCNYPFQIFSPFINKDKEDIIKIADIMNVSLENTHSCYTSNNKHCGTCLSCRLRKEGFYWSGVEDKTEYKEN